MMSIFGNDVPFSVTNRPTPALLIASTSESAVPGKMEPYHLSKSIGVGANLKQPTKTYFSPASFIASSPYNHPSQHAHASIYNNSFSTNSTNIHSSGIPINLSNSQSVTPATTTTTSETSAAAIVSHLPTAALAAACPTTAIRGSSQAHHQQSPINGSPYHSSHSPTLPVARKKKNFY